MSGVFNRKPTWDPQTVLNHLKGYPHVKEMTLKQLTLKMTMLMALVTAQRTQTLKLLSIQDMHVKPGEYSFHIMSLLKQTSASGGKQRHLQPVIFRNMNMTAVCVFTLLEEYLIRTAQLRSSSSQLLLYHTKPHGPAS